MLAPKRVLARIASAAAPADRFGQLPADRRGIGFELAMADLASRNAASRNAGSPSLTAVVRLLLREA